MDEVVQSVNTQAAFVPNPRGGPRTERGRARSSMNAIKSGICADRHVVAGIEDSVEFERFAKTILAELSVKTTIERAIAEGIIGAAWRLRRVQKYEAVKLAEGSLSNEDVRSIERATGRHQRCLASSLDQLFLLQSSGIVGDRKVLRGAGKLLGVSKKGKGNRTPISVKLRFSILHRDGFVCKYCGVSSIEEPLEIDHVVPVALGGTNDPANLVAACSKCNAGKSSKQL